MNCKPGDLAIVVGAMQTPENIGRIVEIVQRAVANQIFKSIDGMKLRLETTRFCWVCRSETPVLWRIPDGRAWEFTEFATSDEFLRPVSGLPIDEDVTEDLKEPAL